MSTFWLVVYLFAADGKFISKDIYETASMEQCEEFAGDVTKTIINTDIQAQFRCVSDEDYRMETFGDDK